jgi:hypothetical protein
VLHRVKVELDNVIEHDQPGLGVPAGALSRQQAALKNLRYQLNDTLERAIPAYKSANETSSMLARRAEAVKAGTGYLGAQKTTPTPAYFAKSYGELSPDEQIALQKGSNAEINRLLGVRSNNLEALRSELQGEGGFNAAKLATVHGQPAADALVRSVDSNRAFRQTFNDVVRNSQTAQRTAASNAMKPVAPGDVPLVNPNMTLAGFTFAGLKKVGGKALNQLRPDPTRSYGEVARALTEQGAARDRRIAAVADALDRRKGNSLVAAKGGYATALLGAIAANGYANRRRNRD